MTDTLPIDAVLAPLTAALTAHGRAVLVAPPGAGKTTRVPLALLDQIEGRIVMLEPRRLAARAAAERLADSLGEKLGQRVGYRIRGESVPGRVIPLALQHTASTGIDVWFAAIAYGAAGISVLLTGREAPQYIAALDQQMEIAQAVLGGLGYEGPHFQLLRVEAPDELAVALRHAPRGRTPGEPALFHLANDKRNTLDYALEHLHRHAPCKPEQVALPASAPFGAIEVDRKACSLCMSCVGACPAGALQDGQGAPLLRFIEKNCVQCGLCASTCPEDAITLAPRLSFMESRGQAVVLNESQPFHCIRCDKPFGTLQMVENMLGRLASHPAFSGHLDRLRMCGDCRVIDMMEPRDEMRVTTLRRM